VEITANADPTALNARLQPAHAHPAVVRYEKHLCPYLIASLITRPFQNANAVAIANAPPAARANRPAASKITSRPSLKCQLLKTKKIQSCNRKIIIM
jgi:hypothetical protein